ncbi:AAA family ATPase [Parashewanella tropica]|uniref:AAA family ATPase n=1 Tax=Parashewanella tropica TaxID=2547970 RepID=UPI001059BB80|nr:AAA family ATPase [Parashewanella tropica]
MYKAFFGLKDTPFSIAPNPDYLFLSERHREALAHLSYGLGDTGGFVLLTGEVGTGKTTVSRTLLKQLPDNTDTAFILNPALTELELLATLCDELKIDYPESPTLKQLTDRISEFLLENHEKGRNTLMIIDEAQHLKAEVLEQLRLLTNLETDTKKLLQVILIGQPELQQLLKRQELRQLAQRITARYHLLPLTEDEVALYVQHRLEVAGRYEPLFTRKSIKALHKHSGGIPRLINLLCERTLMAGYGQSKVPLDHHMVNRAAQEILGVEEVAAPKYKWPLLIGGALVASFAVAYVGFNHFQSPQVFEPSVGVAKTPERSEQVDNPILTQAIGQSRDIKTAFSVLLGLWGKTPYQNLTSCQAAQAQQLNCYQQQGDWKTLLRMGYPAVLYLKDESGRPFYGALVAVDDHRALIQLGEQQLWIQQSWLDTHYDGTFELLWQNVGAPDSTITRYAPIEQIQWLENQLANYNHEKPREMTHFDAPLIRTLKDFQKQNGLLDDGIAGKQTLVLLSLFAEHSGPDLSAAKELY